MQTAARAEHAHVCTTWTLMTCGHLQRNRAKVCTYFIRGKCNRGAECPFRHEMPEGGELAHQNIRDRYYGNNDPVARKMLRRLGERPRLEPPEDTAITTLYVGNVERNWTEDDLRSVFVKHGELTRVKLVPNKSCAFVTYATRDVRRPLCSPYTTNTTPNRDTRPPVS